MSKEQSPQQETNPTWYELRNAVYRKEFNLAESLLQENPELQFLKNGIGETVLHFLAVENDIEGVGWLYEHGFDLNTKNAFGDPVIFEIALLGYKDLFIWFSQQGTITEALGRDGKNIIEYLQDYDDKEDMIEFIKSKNKIQ